MKHKKFTSKETPQRELTPEEQKIFRSDLHELSDHDILVTSVEAQRWMNAGINKINDHLAMLNGCVGEHENRIARIETKLLVSGAFFTLSLATLVPILVCFL